MQNEFINFSFLIPVYNEEKTIEMTIHKCKKVLVESGKSYEIIVIDDASTDQTGEILKRIENISKIINPYNLGYGASLKKGLRLAKGEWVIIADADGTYPIEKLPELLKPTANYDMVVANRQHDQDHFGRRPAKWFLKKIASFLAGHKIPDLNSGFRVFRRDLALEFMPLFPSGFSFTTTITLACYTRDYTVAYVDMPYYERVGKSSIKPTHFFQFLNLILRMFVHFKPIRMFMPFAAVFFLIGLARLTRDYLVAGHIGNLAIIFIMASFLIFILALSTESIVRSR